jgi:hypothetical protein
MVADLPLGAETPNGFLFREVSAAATNIAIIKQRESK